MAKTNAPMASYIWFMDSAFKGISVFIIFPFVNRNFIMR